MQKLLVQNRGEDMGFRKAAVLFIPLLCIFLAGCGLQDYPTYTYELTNGLGEKYLINYCEQTDYPENVTRVKIFREKNKIGDYNGGAYTGCDSYIPSQMMFLCSDGSVDYYYMRSQIGEYIVADGIADLKLNSNMMSLGRSVPDMTDTERSTYKKLAEIVRGAVSAETAQEHFSECGYNSSEFMTFYNFDT